MRSAFTKLKKIQSSRHPVQTPAEISEARLRTGMDLEAPHAPPIFEISQDWVGAQSLYQHSSKPTQLRLQCQLPAAHGP